MKEFDQESYRRAVFFHDNPPPKPEPKSPQAPPEIPPTTPPPISPPPIGDPPPQSAEKYMKKVFSHPMDYQYLFRLDSQQEES